MLKKKASGLDFEVVTSDRDYKTERKVFKTSDQDPPNAGEDKAREYARKLKEKDNADKYGKYRSIEVRRVKADGTTNTFGGDTGNDADFFASEGEAGVGDSDINFQQDKDIEEQAFVYLDELRESGVTNMFEAGSYLENEFTMDKKQAREILLKWMNTFGKRHPKAKRKT
jgi:hypothetical protein